MVDTNAIGDIRDFFRQKSVFVTGGTGFVGKVLLEKLLRSCDLKKIYLLIRNKHGIDPDTRINQLFDNKLYNRLKKEKPDFLDKVVCIHGDFNEKNIGISNEDYQMLCNNVSVIFHIGATVRFDLSLRETLMHNLYPMKILIELAKKMIQLKSFVYVSTAFSNTHEEDIYEKVYTSEIPVKSILDFINWMDNDTFEILKAKLLSRHPNNYCYSKCLAEQLLKEEEKNLPTVILRPPLISGTLKEPVKGWLEQYNLMTAFIISYGKGLIRLAHNNLLRAHYEYVPVDYCVNMTIASAWDRAKKGNTNIIVYNCTSGMMKKDINEISKITAKLRKYPFMNSYRYPVLFATRSNILHFIYNIFLQLLPAILLDSLYIISGKKAKMCYIYQKLSHRFRDSEFFLSNVWNFHANNFLGLLQSMSEEEKEIFDFDLRNIDYSEYLDNIVFNIRTNLLKESPSSIPEARSRMEKLKYAEIFIYFLFFGGLCFLPIILWIYIS